MNYTGKTVSSETPVTQPEAVNAILNAFDIRFQTYIEDGNLKLWGDDTFDVYDVDLGDDATEPFLAALSFFLEDTLTITSIGYTGNRHEPDSFRWEVTNNTITYRRLDGTEETTAVEAVLSEIPDDIRATYLPVQ